MTPLVSVLLPVYNGERYIKQCIQSVLSQTSPPEFELLICDDASTDGSMRIIEECNDPRMRVFRHETNNGLFATLNGLIDVARARYIRFLCQDDALSPRCLEREAAFAARLPDCGILFSKTIRIGPDGAEIGRCEIGDLPKHIDPAVARSLLFYYGCIPGNLSTVTIARVSIEAVGSFDTRFGVSADYELWARIAELFPLGVIHEHLVLLRQHVEQLSFAPSSAIEAIRANRIIRSRLLKNMPPRCRWRAHIFAAVRPLALDTHFVLRCLATGDFIHAARAARAIGAMNLILGVLTWLITLGNHLIRPRGPAYLRQ